MGRSKKASEPGAALALAAATALLLAGCGGATPDLSGPELRADLSGLTPEAAERIEQARESLLADPRDPEGWLRLGMVCEANGMLDLALSSYARLREVAPERPAAWYRTAVARSKLGRTEEALAAVERAIALEPGFAPALWRRGFWRLEMGDLDGAHPSFLEATRLDPRDAAGWTGLARVYLQSDDPDLAVQVLEHVLSIRPGDRYAQGLLADAHRQAGRWGEVARHAVLAGGAGPYFPDPRELEMLDHRADAFSARFERASAALYESDPERAIVLLEDLRRERGADVKLHQLLAHAYTQVGRLEEARDVYRTCLELEPESSWTLVNLAQVLGRLGETRAALETVERALRQQPTLGLAHELEGELLRELGRTEEAVDAYREGLLHDARNPLTLVRIGNLELELARWDAAATSFREALERASDLPQAYVGLARAQLELGRTEDARDTLDRMPREPADPALLNEVRRRLAGRSASRSDDD